MTMPESILSRMRGLIKRSVNVTGENVGDITQSINTLSLGYGGAPIPYDEAKDGDKLYDVYFASGNFTFIDDNEQGFDDGGELEVWDENLWGYVSSEYPPNQWRKGLVTNPDIENGRSLLISGDDVTSDDYRAIGYLPMYDLENKTYTYEFEYFRNFDKRHKFYFATGNFLSETGSSVSNGGIEPTMPCLALELNKSGDYVDYRLYRQSSGFVNDTNLFNRKTILFQTNASGEFTANIKVIIRGGAKVYETIYQHWGLSPNAPSDTWQPRWTGYLIPLHITIYHSDVKVAEVIVYQPVGTGLVCGVGNWEKLSGREYCGVRNLSIYRGDRTNIAPSADVEPYEGNYTVKPAVTAQTLNTTQKYLSKDITVKAIPYAEVSNASGGTTITIG